MHLTPGIMEAAYSLLRETPPFARWRLPEADEVGFVVTRDRLVKGDYGCENGSHVIRLSSAVIGSLGELLITMAHEMCHLRQQLVAPKDAAHHGTRFRQYAEAVCRVHGFDRKAF